MPVPVVVRVPSAGEDAQSVVAAIAAADPADVVLLGSGCVVPEGWLGGLQDAAYSDGRVATASALTMAGAEDLAGAAAALRTRSLRLRPRLSTPSRDCVYIRRSALELIGEFDAGFFRRCTEHGLLHLLADDVLVTGREEDWSQEGEPVGRAVSRARRAARGSTVVIDARILSREMTGTEVQVLEVIGALARTGKVRVSAIVPDQLKPYAARALGSLPEVAQLRSDEAIRADVVHRPYQVSNPGDVAFLASLGERLVLTNQDLIAYHNHSYFESPDAWQDFRRLTRLALATADRVVFVSAHARDDALAEELVEPSRASVVHNGVDHSVAVAREPPRPPAIASELPDDAEAILCLGTDYRHKNRPFALRMLAELQRRHGWLGHLVFAGPSMPTGSSREDEDELMRRHPDLRDAVVDAGMVSEAEKAWLLERTRLVLYPTTSEGFGLVPFEAAAEGVPCLWAAGTSLTELLPAGATTIVPWNAAASADRAFELMRDESARERQVRLVREAAVELTWDAAASALVELYEMTCDAPRPPGAAIERADGLMSGAISEDAMRLVGPAGALPADVERPLLALATHPRLGGPLFRVLELGYRATYRWRRRGERS